MEFYDIEDSDTVESGEYIFHTPTKTIVLCGGFSRSENSINALKYGKLLMDDISNFQKIRTTRTELYRTTGTKHIKCGSCKGR